MRYQTGWLTYFPYRHVNNVTELKDSDAVYTNHAIVRVRQKQSAWTRPPTVLYPEYSSGTTG